MCFIFCDTNHKKYRLIALYKLNVWKILQLGLILFSIISGNGYTQPEESLEAFCFFYPGTPAPDQSTTISLAITGKGQYNIELYSPAQYIHSHSAHITEENTGIIFTISLPFYSSVVIKLYSIQDVKLGKFSDTPEFQPEESSINKWPFTSDSIHVYPKGTNAPTKEKTANAEYPKTFFGFFHQQQAKDKPRELQTYVLDDGNRFYKTTMHLSKKNNIILDHNTEKLSMSGTFCLYHLLGGHFAFTPAFFSGGYFYTKALLSQCKYLIATTGHSRDVLLAGLNYIEWLKTENIANYQNDSTTPIEKQVEDYKQSCPRLLNPFPPEIHALYQTFLTQADTLSPDNKDYIFKNKAAPFYKLVCKRPRENLYPSLTKKIGSTFGSAYYAALTSSSTIVEKPNVTIRSRQIENNRLEGSSGTDTPPLSTTTAQKRVNQAPFKPLTPPPSSFHEGENCNPLDTSNLAFFLPCRPKKPPTCYLSSLDILERGYENFDKLLPEVDTPPFPCPAQPDGLMYDSSLPFPPGLRREYTPLKLLGQGTEGQCFLVKQVSSDDIYALKLEKSFEKSSDEEIRQFGLLKMKAFDHPQAVAVHKQKIIPVIRPVSKRQTKKSTPPPTEKWYLQLQEFCPGGDLQAILDKEGSLSPYTRWATVVSLLNVITTFHSRHIVHRDLKPGNIFIGEDGHLRVADFGMAKLIKGNSMTTSIVGTVPYTGRVLSRRLDEGPAEYNDYLPDHIALGAICYALGTGEHFYHTPDITNVALSIQAQFEYYDHLCNHGFTDDAKFQKGSYESAVQKMAHEIKNKHKNLGLSYDENFGDLTAKLLCSHLLDKIESDALLAYCNHPYILEKPTVTLPSSEKTTKRECQPVMYCPETLLSDNPNLLRPTLVVSHIISRIKAVTEHTEKNSQTARINTKKPSDIKEMGEIMRQHYFFQPLPEQHCSWHHAWLLGRLIQIVHEACSSDNPQEIYNLAKIKIEALSDDSDQLKTVTELISDLSEHEYQQHRLKALYDSLLEGSTLYKASPRFIKAANELANFAYSQVTLDQRFDDRARLNALDNTGHHYHIVDEDDLSNTLLYEPSNKIVFYKSTDGWGLFIPKK